MFIFCYHFNKRILTWVFKSRTSYNWIFALYVILIYWAWFSMSRNLLGFGQSSTHPLQDNRWMVHTAIMRRSCIFNKCKSVHVDHVSCLYDNMIYERNKMILISCIETFIFKRDVIIQMVPIKWCLLQVNCADKIQKSHNSKWEWKIQFFVLRIFDCVIMDGYPIFYSWYHSNYWYPPVMTLSKMVKTKNLIFYSLSVLVCLINATLIRFFHG